jgi:hypothetical protein
MSEGGCTRVHDDDPPPPPLWRTPASASSVTHSTAIHITLTTKSHMHNHAHQHQPSDLTDNGKDVRSRVSMTLARSSDGWTVTLVNNLGVTKRPSIAAVTDPTMAINVTLGCTWPHHHLLNSDSVPPCSICNTLLYSY